MVEIVEDAFAYFLQIKLGFEHYEFLKDLEVKPSVDGY